MPACLGQNQTTALRSSSETIQQCGAGCATDHRPFATEKLSDKQITWQVALRFARARLSALANAGQVSLLIQNCGTPAFAFSNIDEVGGGVPRQRPPPAQMSDFRIADQRAFPSHRVSVIYRSTGFPVIYGSTNCPLGGKFSILYEVPLRSPVVWFWYHAPGGSSPRIAKSISLSAAFCD
jgi:hypothetical protein